MTTEFEKTLAAENLIVYGLSMADFLEYVRRRKAELRKELQEIETAERIYRQATDEPAAHVLPQPAEMEFTFLGALAASAAAKFAKSPKTIQEMVLQLLDEVYPGGLTALEILDQIQRRWKPDLMRTSLSPQLSRLHESSSVTNSKQKWYLAVKNETGASANAPA